MNVLIIPDKFKGTLAASAAAAALARGWRSARPMDRLELLPMTDGGDGFGETLGRLLGARTRTVRTLDAAHRPCVAQWWFEPANRTALIESANIIGLAMLPPGRFHPFELDTFGLGAAIRAAARAGARRCFVGLGGSATNDAGFGLARALGWVFLDNAGESIEAWTGLRGLAGLRAPKRRRWFRELLVAVDVSNPLLGPRGATRIYGPQKGLRQSDFKLAEGALRRLTQIMEQKSARRMERVPGTGAAGGLGFGFAAFLGGKLVPGFDLFARQTDLARRLRWADLVITGEGALDHSTLMGKGVGQIAKRCRRARIPCLGVGGTAAPDARLKVAFTKIRALTEIASLEDAKARPAFLLEQLARQMARDWKP